MTIALQPFCDKIRNLSIFTFSHDNNDMSHPCHQVKSTTTIDVLVTFDLWRGRHLEFSPNVSVPPSAQLVRPGKNGGSACGPYNAAQGFYSFSILH